MKRTTIVRCRAFTLIEILVVVAIIALLIAILVPTLARAKEQTRRVVCLSNMKQMGVAFSAYGSDSKGNLPWPARFRYMLMAGEGQLMPGGQGSRWVPSNIGGLYPKYVGKQAKLFYCPSCTQLTPENKDTGIPKLQYLTMNPVQTNSPQRPNDTPFSPQSTYVYARPAAPGRHPKDAGPKMYPNEVIQSDALTRFDPGNDGTWADAWKYINDSAQSNWLVPTPQNVRLKAALPVYVSDAYFGGFLGYHIDGYNVMFADFHARRIRDPYNKISQAGITTGTNYNMDGSIGKQFQVWDYFGRNP
ncbi:MAG TPA: prepilin-type N-terminal cleavage/methylation domain-containing protein [Phycisphaerae bacterium]|nr:prepilin-type N-terminal cleavage/methylation domain-containing protein [Phycisphaerae bacterium]